MIAINHIVVLLYEDKMLTTLFFNGIYVSSTKSDTGIHATYTPTNHFYMKDHWGYLRRTYQ